MKPVMVYVDNVEKKTGSFYRIDEKGGLLQGTP